MLVKNSIVKKILKKNIVNNFHCKKYLIFLVEKIIVKKIWVFGVKISLKIFKFHCKKNYCKIIQFFIVKKFHCIKISL